jgi:excinuclease ABC subunit A
LKAVAVQITIRGASEHNLQGVDVEFGDGLTVVTGVSGSGKTSLVFDTLYHEARRRFLEVFSLGGSARFSPARVESIAGLGPAIAVGQNLLNRNPASTLATASGLHPFFRLLYARFGARHCAHCGARVLVPTEDEIVEHVADLVRRGHETVTVLAPLFHAAPGSHLYRSLSRLDEAGDWLSAEPGTPFHPYPFPAGDELPDSDAPDSDARRRRF